MGTSSHTDAGGNKKLPPIGEFIKEQITLDFKKHHLCGANVRYIDPSYMIRSVPANSADALYCMMLAQNAVHGSMAGFTAFSTGCYNMSLFQ